MKKTKQPIDYSKGKIYKIWSFNTDEIYIGSTIQSLGERLRGHERDFKYFKEGTRKGFVSSFIILENEHYDIELIEYCPCKTKAELHRREGELQREMNCINKNIAGRTKKEYLEDNSERFDLYYKEYRKNHKCDAKKYKKIYTEKYREKIKENDKKYRENHREEIKEYYDNNRDKLLAQKKIYRENNKEKIAERKKNNRVICECGTDIARDKKSRHIKTLLHTI
jgi:hypothetical protein